VYVSKEDPQRCALTLYKLLGSYFFSSTCVLFDMCTASPPYAGGVLHLAHVQCVSFCACVCVCMSHLCVIIHMHADRYV
jgi:hypothetical protein